MKHKDGTKKTKHRVMDFIIWYKETYDGVSPSVREIAEAVEVKTTSTIYTHLDNLVADGKLIRHPHVDPGAARCIMVTGGKWNKGD